MYRTSAHRPLEFRRGTVLANGEPWHAGGRAIGGIRRPLDHFRDRGRVRSPRARGAGGGRRGDAKGTHQQQRRLNPASSRRQPKCSSSSSSSSDSPPPPPPSSTSSSRAARSSRDVERRPAAVVVADRGALPEIPLRSRRAELHSRGGHAASARGATERGAARRISPGCVFCFSRARRRESPFAHSGGRGSRTRFLSLSPIARCYRSETGYSGITSFRLAPSGGQG